MNMPDQRLEDQPQGSSDRVVFGIMGDLEEGRMVPGQRLVETDLAARFGVGRNAVREAVQQLSARGVVDLSRHRSPAIRMLDFAQAQEVLDVASVLMGLAARAAAAHFQEPHTHMIVEALSFLEEADSHDEPAMFSRARRNFYRTVLHIGNNRELQRLLPAVGVHIIYAQHQSRQLRGRRIADYRQIMEAIAARDPDAAASACYAHVEHVREAIAQSERK